MTKMYSLRDYIKVMGRLKKVGDESLDVDKESGGLPSSIDAKTETQDMKPYTDLLSRPTSSTTK